MTTAAQLSANRMNAKRSTGPRSSENSVMNALKHGLRSSVVALLPAEERGDWDALLNDLRSEWDPQTPTEELLVTKMSAAEWKRRRAEHFEVGCLVMEGAAEEGSGTAMWRDASKAQAIGLVVRYRRAAAAEFTGALHELERMQARRKLPQGANVPLPLAVDVNITGSMSDGVETDAAE